MIKRFMGKFLTTILFLGAFTTGAFADVMQEWVATYNGQANGNDSGAKNVVDAQSNVYVTGTSEGTYGKDFLTIKYSPLGEKQWEARYDGSYGYDDSANAIALDRNGNVYVTGASQGSDGCWFYATIKYSSEGAEEWIRREGAGCSNQPTAISTDSSGNVYVTGNFGSNIGTIKYDTNGIQQWNVIYESDVPYGYASASAMVTDANGNVYITGSTGYWWGKKYLTIKYDTNGGLQWTARYSGPAQRDDGAFAIAVDTNGNVYVTGYTFTWQAGSDYGTVKYDPNGIQQWVAVYNGPPYYGLDVATSLSVDTNGNVYVTGYSEGRGTSLDYATVKYNNQGIAQWVRRYNGPGNGYDMARQVALDASGNIYVVGASSGIGTGLDYATVRYNSFGDEQWVMRYNGLGNGDDTANSIATDDTGNVYVTGGSYGGATGLDYATIKYRQETMVVAVDIKPGSFPNSINPHSNGVIPVAILSTNSFDTTDVDPLSVRFGPDGATIVHKADIEDVNNDGILDLILHFDTEATGVKEGDVVMSLICMTYGGKFIQGSDSIVTVGSNADKGSL